MLCWIVSFTNFVVLVHNLWQSTSPVCRATPGICKFAKDDYNPLRHAAPSLGMAIAPLLVCADVADVSSMCDSLMNAINDLRLEWTSTEDAQSIHQRTFPLQCTLERMNQGQGLGVSRKLARSHPQLCTLH